jgi:hypothetical protein
MLFLHSCVEPINTLKRGKSESTIRVFNLLWPICSILSFHKIIYLQYEFLWKKLWLLRSWPFICYKCFMHMMINKETAELVETNTCSTVMYQAARIMKHSRCRSKHMFIMVSIYTFFLGHHVSLCRVTYSCSINGCHFYCVVYVWM